jgi:hypothetical protein
MRYTEIDLANLPRTLVDAAWFTRQLGIDYIWIDSLCIVQDDVQEWAEEAGHMADIYSAAYVVLSATLAGDVTKGFLGRHFPPPYNFTSEMSHRKNFTAHAWRSDHDYGVVRLDALPVSRRGWCLQEGLLATRIVHFLPSEVAFMCKSAHVCECGLAKVPEFATRSWPPL